MKHLVERLTLACSAAWAFSFSTLYKNKESQAYKTAKYVCIFHYILHKLDVIMYVMKGKYHGLNHLHFTSHQDLHIKTDKSKNK